MKFHAYTDYARTMTFHNGTVETIWHCGKCMTIKAMKGGTCSYCSHNEDKKRAALRKLLDRKKGENNEDLL